MSSIGSMFGVGQKGDADAWKMSGGMEIGGSGSQKSADSGWLWGMVYRGKVV